MLAIAAAGFLHVIPQVHAPVMISLALCTTGLGVLIPVFRDGGQLETPFGRLMIAAGTLGEVGPVVAMSLLLSQRYSTWQEAGFLIAFLGIVTLAIAVGTGAKPPRLLAFLGREMRTSTQLPVRIALLTLAALHVLADQQGGKALREKLDAVAFGWFYPFFFVGTARQVRCNRAGSESDHGNPGAGIRRAVAGHTRNPSVPLSQRHHTGAAIAFGAGVGRPVALIDRGHHRDGASGESDESGRRRRPDRRCTAGRAVVPDRRRCADAAACCAGFDCPLSA